MDKMIQRVGNYICKITNENPDYSRKIILIAYLLYKLKLYLLPVNY